MNGADVQEFERLLNEAVWSARVTGYNAGYDDGYEEGYNMGLWDA